MDAASVASQPLVKILSPPLPPLPPLPEPATDAAYDHGEAVTTQALAAPLPGGPPLPDGPPPQTPPPSGSAAAADWDPSTPAQPPRRPIMHSPQPSGDAAGYAVAWDTDAPLPYGYPPVHAPQQYGYPPMPTGGQPYTPYGFPYPPAPAFGYGPGRSYGTDKGYGGMSSTTCPPPEEGWGYGYGYWGGPPQPRPPPSYGPHPQQRHAAATPRPRPPRRAPAKLPDTLPAAGPLVFGVKHKSSGEGGSQRKQPRRSPPSCIAVNKRIVSARCCQDILDIVAADAADFDTVCMATALHRMAALDAGPVHYEHIASQPEFHRLLVMTEARLQDMSGRNVANMLWALARMGLQASQLLLDGLTAAALAKLPSMNSQNIANSLWGFATLEHDPGEQLLNAMAASAESILDKCNSQNISNIMLAFAKLGHNPGTHFLDALSRTTRSKLKEFTPQALSNTAWGFSKLGVEDGPLLDDIAAAAAPLIERGSAIAQNLANLAWSFANLNYAMPERLLAAIVATAESGLRDFSAQNASNLIWAMARLGHAPEKLLQAVAAQAGACMDHWQPQSIANLCWAYATLDVHPGHTFVARTLSRAVDTLPTFSPQNMANVAWSMATLKDSNSQEFLKAVAAETVARLTGDDEAKKRNFSRQHLSNIMWAFATMEQQPGTAMCEAVAEAMVTRAGDCNPQEMSNVVWSYAKLGQYNEDLMDAFAAESRRRMHEFSAPQNLANLAWAFGKLAHYDADLMAAVAEQAVLLTKVMHLQHLCNIIWSYACLGLVVPHMLEALQAEVRSRLASETLNAQQLSNIVWALTVLRHCPRDVWVAAMDQFARLAGSNPSVLPPEALTQVHQARLLMQLELAPGELLTGPPGLLSAAAAMWSETARRVHISEFHADVASQLRAMGIPHTIEQPTEDGAFSIDIAVSQERIAVEVDGPHHFTANTRAPVGETAGRYRLLAARGWQVVSVPYWHWDAAPPPAAKQAWLAKALEQARVQQAAPWTAESSTKAAVMLFDAPAAFK